MAETDRAHPDGSAEAKRPRSSRFRFKFRQSNRRQEDAEEEPHVEVAPSTSRQSRRHRRHRHDRHRRHRRRADSPLPDEHDPFAPEAMEPETAFREALFDAMADDEGAAYWEGVYGQPMHVYTDGRERLDAQSGRLERMADEEYADYVRREMWARTNAGKVEELERRRREQREAEARRRAEQEAARRVRAEMESSLLRGEERRREREWRTRWENYVRLWAEWDGREASGIPWPTRDGVKNKRGAEVTSEKVRQFFVHGLGLAELGERNFMARLKEERVRWHPDKMQHRMGGAMVDKAVMRNVTAVFQTIDSLWNDVKGQAQDG